MTFPAATKQAFDYFVAMGWTPAQSAGIVANLIAESNLNPAAVGDGGKAYGIAQHHPDRQAGFAAIIGHDIRGSTLEEQLAYVHAELRGTEKAAGDALGACTTAKEAGAVVSTLYERPADREGEAARRGALAQAILDRYGGSLAGAAPSPIPAPIQAPAAPAEAPMGALAPIFLQTLLPAVLGLFSQKAQDRISKATGASPDAAAAFYQHLMEQIGGVAGIPIPAGDTPQARAAAIQAVAAVTKPEAAPQVAQLEQGSIEYLEKLLPVLDKLSAYEKAAWDAEEASRDAAGARGRTDIFDLAPMLAISAVLLVAITLIALAAIMGIQAWFLPNHEPTTALLTLVGPLLGVVFTGAFAVVYGYRFGSSRSSAAKDVVLGEIAKAK